MVFESKHIEEKSELIRKNNACARGLGKGHSRMECHRNFTCRASGCGEPHHTLIHEAHERGMSFHGNQASGNDAETLLLLQRILARHNSQVEREWP